MLDGRGPLRCTIIALSIVERVMLLMCGRRRWTQGWEGKSSGRARRDGRGVGRSRGALSTGCPARALRERPRMISTISYDELAHYLAYPLGRPGFLYLYSKTQSSFLR